MSSNSGSSFAKKEKLVNSNEDEDGGYTEVAVVDNPLYAENEGEVAAYLGEEIEKAEDEAEVEVTTNRLALVHYHLLHL